ncbi:MAG: TRAP transporter large permease [Deltaproteobacteria bacterium]|nr:TRAP transporter large permease [Deltaproteobacteria bacterium]
MISPEAVGWIGMAAFLVLLFLGIPVAATMFLVGFIGYAAISGLYPGLAALGIMPYHNIATYSLTVIPLFILMGHFASHAGFARDIFTTARKWVSTFPGGIVQATIAGSAAFGAACGSGMASCAIVSKLTIPEMLRSGVNREISFGAVASAGTIASMIPPSILMIIYGIITSTPIGKLLVAGFIPGLIAAFNYMIMVYIRVKRNPGLAPTLESVSWKERLSGLRGIWGIAVMILIVLGGIYSGIFTPIEAGGFGAFGAFFIALLLKRMRWANLKECLLETVKTSGSILIVVAGAFFFTYFIGISRIPAVTSEYLTSLHVPGMIIIIGIMAMYIVLGSFMDVVPALFLTLPIIFPTVTALEYDPIWFGVLIVHIVEIGMITPPFGINLFILRGIIPEAKAAEVIRGVVPFIIADLFTLIIYMAFPQVALFLPNMMK